MGHSPFGSQGCEEMRFHRADGQREMELISKIDRCRDGCAIFEPIDVVKLMETLSKFFGGK